MTMETLDLDNLFLIVEATPGLEKVEGALREAGHDAAAHALSKLMQDAGVQIDREIILPSVKEKYQDSLERLAQDAGESVDVDKAAMTIFLASGPVTAKLNAAFEPVTAARLSILSDIATKLTAQAEKASLDSLIAALPQLPEDSILPLQNQPKPSI